MTGAITAFYGAMNYKASIDKFIPNMGLNMAATVLTPVILWLCHNLCLEYKSNKDTVNYFTLFTRDSPFTIN